MASIANRSSVLVYASLCFVLFQSSVYAASEQKPGAVPAAAQAGREVPRGATLPPDRVKPTPVLQMGVRGTDAKRLTGEAAGLPRSALPGTHFISSDEWKKMRKIPKTGLFIVDADYIPGNLPEDLKSEGFRMDPNGGLTDAKGTPRAIFVLPQTYELSGKGSGRQGSLDRSFGGGIIGTAQAGSPYWFACYSAQAWLVYSNGFCRYQDLKTKGWAYGPKAGGGCGWPVPATNISSIQVWAWIHSHSYNSASCSNCSSKGVTASWDIGCFWPAYGGSTFENYANLTDNDPAHGNPRADAYWVWGH